MLSLSLLWHVDDSSQREHVDSSRNFVSSRNTCDDFGGKIIGLAHIVVTRSSSRGTILHVRSVRCMFESLHALNLRFCGTCASVSLRNHSSNSQQALLRESSFDRGSFERCLSPVSVSDMHQKDGTWCFSTYAKSSRGKLTHLLWFDRDLE